MTNDIVRFYISPEGKLSYANIKKVFNAKPYDGILYQVEDVFSVRENTDINYDSNFNYAVSSGDTELFLMISMVGRYALIYSNRRGIFVENHTHNSELFVYLREMMVANNIELVNGPILKSKVSPVQAGYRRILDKNIFYYLFERE